MPEKTIRWSVHVVHPSLESYAKGRVALLGDAVRDRTMLTAFFPLMNQKIPQAHAMLPHLGAGAGQGIEDVFLLTRLLSHPDTRIANVHVSLTGRPHA